MGEEYIRRIMVLGSVPSLGPVILFDDIEGLLKWVASGTGTGYVVEKLTTAAYNGSACLHVKTRTVGASADDIVVATRSFFRRPGLRYRVESLFEILVNSNCKLCDFEVYLYDGTARHAPGVRYDVVNQKWQYRTGIATYTDVPGGSQNLEGADWHRVLFEFDEARGVLTRLICDGLELSGLNLGYYRSSAVGGVYCLLNLSIGSVSTTPPEAYFDDVLVMEI